METCLWDYERASVKSTVCSELQPFVWQEMKDPSRKAAVTQNICTQENICSQLTPCSAAESGWRQNLCSLWSAGAWVLHPEFGVSQKTKVASSVACSVPAVLAHPVNLGGSGLLSDLFFSMPSLEVPEFLKFVYLGFPLVCCCFFFFFLFSALRTELLLEPLVWVTAAFLFQDHLVALKRATQHRCYLALDGKTLSFASEPRGHYQH